MKAQIVLTPTESKKLIAKAIVKMKEVDTALREGLVVMHPSTSTYFIFQELTGETPGTEVWLSGTIGRIVAAVKKRKFTILYPVGLEKLIPLSIEMASK